MKLNFTIVLLFTFAPLTLAAHELFDAQEKLELKKLKSSEYLQENYRLEMNKRQYRLLHSLLEKESKRQKDLLVKQWQRKEPWNWLSKLEDDELMEKYIKRKFKRKE